MYIHVYIILLLHSVIVDVIWIVGRIFNEINIENHDANFVVIGNTESFPHESNSI